jgi:hypothetical protein
MNPNEYVAGRIAKARAEAGLTLEKVGEELGHYLERPWKASHVWAIENPVITNEEGEPTGQLRRSLRLEELFAFALVLGKPVDWFVSAEELVQVTFPKTGQTATLSPREETRYPNLNREQVDVADALAQIRETVERTLSDLKPIESVTRTLGLSIGPIEVEPRKGHEEPEFYRHSIPIRMSPEQDEQRREEQARAAREERKAFLASPEAEEARRKIRQSTKGAKRS